MTSRIASSTIAEAATAGLALLGAVISGDAALVALGAPLALAAALGLAAEPPELADVEISVEPRVASTESQFLIELAVTARAPQLCSLDVRVPPGMAAGGPTHFELYLRPGVIEQLAVPLRALRPGRFAVGEIDVRCEGTAPGRRRSGQVTRTVQIEARPDPVALRGLIRSERVRAQAGDRVGRLPGDGIEFAEVREQAAGAMGRRINWRATARRGTTCVNLHHPERNTDVMLLVDTFAKATMPSVLRISVNLAESYLARHDRLGLVCFGGVLDWVEPGTGPAHGDRVLNSLISSESYFSYAWKTADLIPRRLIPPGCLVVAVSPLSDDRFVRALADLRSRGLDLAIVEIAQGWPAPLSPTGRLATRILDMERDDLRQRFWQMGVPLAAVDPDDSAELALARLVSLRRALRRRAPA